jgi:hypothetical protein
MGQAPGPVSRWISAPGSNEAGCLSHAKQDKNELLWYNTFEQYSRT